MVSLWEKIRSSDTLHSEPCNSATATATATTFSTRCPGRFLDQVSDVPGLRMHVATHVDYTVRVEREELVEEELVAAFSWGIDEDCRLTWWETD